MFYLTHNKLLVSKMSLRISKSNLMRSKSLGTLDSLKDSDFVECNGRFCNYGEGDLQSDSSLEICEIFANKSYGSLEDHLDSGFIHLDPSETSRSDSLLALELKVVKLSGRLHVYDLYCQHTTMSEPISNDVFNKIN